ncbi:MAG: DUF624 domain-containing protein [Arachnia sp.]
MTLRQRAGSDDEGWSHVAMRWLGRLTQTVEVSVATLVGIAAGGIVLGWLPAGVAASDVLGRLVAGEPSDRPFGDFHRSWRAHFGRANRVGWPATVVVLVLAVDGWILLCLRGPWAGVALALTAAAAAWFALAVGFLVNLLSLPSTKDATTWALWRTALLMPLVSPGYAVAWLACIASIGALAWVYPVTAVLLAPGLIALATAWLTRRRLHSTGVATDAVAVG